MAVVRYARAAVLDHRGRGTHGSPHQLKTRAKGPMTTVGGLGAPCSDSTSPCSMATRGS